MRSLKKYIWEHVVLLLLFVAVPLSSMAQNVYSTAHSYQADVEVYVVDHEYQADLLVYKVDHEYQAKGNEGKWYFVEQEYQSDVNIHFVDHEYQADLTVYFVKEEYRAGWKDTSKQHLLDGKKK